MQRRGTPLKDWEWEALRLCASRLGPDWRILPSMLAAERLVRHSSFLLTCGPAPPSSLPQRARFSTRIAIEHAQIEHRLYALFVG